MTKKDFELIASVLNDHRPPVDFRGYDHWKSTVYDFADRLAETNPRFQRMTFEHASGAPVRIAAAKVIDSDPITGMESLVPMLAAMTTRKA
jgi:hypothetical protein